MRNVRPLPPGQVLGGECGQCPFAPLSQRGGKKRHPPVYPHARACSHTCTSSMCMHTFFPVCWAAQPASLSSIFFLFINLLRLLWAGIEVSMIRVFVPLDTAWLLCIHCLCCWVATPAFTSTILWCYFHCCKFLPPFITIWNEWASVLAEKKTSKGKKPPVQINLCELSKTCDALWKQKNSCKEVFYSLLCNHRDTHSINQWNSNGSVARAAPNDTGMLLITILI